MVSREDGIPRNARATVPIAAPAGPVRSGVRPRSGSRQPPPVGGRDATAIVVSTAGGAAGSGTRTADVSVIPVLVCRYRYQRNIML